MVLLCITVHDNFPILHVYSIEWLPVEVECSNLSIVTVSTGVWSLCENLLSSVPAWSVQVNTTSIIFALINIRCFLWNVFFSKVYYMYIVYFCISYKAFCSWSLYQWKHFKNTKTQFSRCFNFLFFEIIYNMNPYSPKDSLCQI